MEGLTILIPTYNRTNILVQTVQRLLNFIICNRPWYILIGDDGDNFFETVNHISAIESPPGRVNVCKGPRNGLGANLNTLLKAAPTEIVMQMDDDHWLTRSLSVNEYMDELETDPAFGWIRLFMGLQSDSNNKETYYNFTARNYGRYWRLMPKISGLYIPSNRPHIKCKEFHRRYGPYDEGVKLGIQESSFCHRFADNHHNDGLLDVFIPMYPPPMDTWMHVGDSWQKEGL